MHLFRESPEYTYSTNEKHVRFLLEDSDELALLNDDGLPSSAPFNAVTNYDHSNTSISHKQSTNKSIPKTPYGHGFSLLLVADIESLPPETPNGHVDKDTISIQKLLQLSSTETPIIGHGGNNKQLLDRFCFSWYGFSQSTACNVTRFGECSSTLLDKLWYTYSYIYSNCRQ